MPTYDYKCPACEKTQELFHKISEEPKPSCPACGTPMKKMPGKGAGLSFIGSGFYSTDYADKPVGPSTSPPAKGGCCPCGKNTNSCSSSG